MIPISSLMRDSAHYSQTMSLTVDIMRGQSVVLANVPVQTGKFSSDRGGKARAKADVTIALGTHPTFQISQNIHRFRVKRGYKSLGVTGEIQHGIFRIDNISRNDDGSVVLEGSGLESYIIDGRFIRPRTPPYGQSTVGQITYLIQEILPRQRVSVECRKDKPIRATAPWDRERWDAIEALADSIDAIVYVDWRGYFVIRDAIHIDAPKAPVYFIKEGEGATLISRSEKSSRDTVYNAASVSGDSTDSNVPAVWAWAYDANPQSPTYYYGDFGQVPIFYTSQFFTSTAQCQAYANVLLAQSLARNQTLSVVTLPLTFLEPDDTVVIELASGEMQRRIIDTVSFDLGVNAAVTMETSFVDVWKGVVPA